MKLKVLGSSSSGNGYVLLDSSGEALVVEAGVKLINVKQAVSFNTSSIAGCIVSHSHNDHARYAPEYQKTGMSIYMSLRTRQKIFGQNTFYNVHELIEKEQVAIGSFLVKPFLLKHDVENFGYLVHHHESGLICFITDTHYCPFIFKGLNNIMVECNYEEEILDRNVAAGSVPPERRTRIVYDHMELNTTKGFLAANDLSGVNNIVLLHLSDGNSDARKFTREIRELTGKSVYAADRGLEIDLNRTAI